MQQKQIGKILKLTSIVISVAVLVALVVMMFAPAINIYVEGSTNNEFDFAHGQDFVGWQVIFYYWGPNIPIGDRAAFRTNVPLSATVVICVLALIICTLTVRKAKGVKCLVVEAIAAIVLAVGACMLLNILTLLENSVGNLVADTLFLAKENGGYTMCPMIAVTAVIMLIAAAIKLFDGIQSVMIEVKTKKLEQDAVSE